MCSFFSLITLYVCHSILISSSYISLKSIKENQYFFKVLKIIFIPIHYLLRLKSLDTQETLESKSYLNTNCLRSYDEFNQILLKEVFQWANLSTIQWWKVYYVKTIMNFFIKSFKFNVWDLIKRYMFNSIDFIDNEDVNKPTNP